MHAQRITDHVRQHVALGVGSDPVAAIRTDMVRVTVAAAFQAIGRACLHYLISNEQILSETRNPDVVHQMRTWVPQAGESQGSTELRPTPILDRYVSD